MIKKHQKVKDYNALPELPTRYHYKENICLVTTSEIFTEVYERESSFFKSGIRVNESMRRDLHNLEGNKIRASRIIDSDHTGKYTYYSCMGWAFPEEVLIEINPDEYTTNQELYGDFK